MKLKIKIQNRKSFLLRDVVISMIMFLGIVALFILIIASISINYNRPDIIDQNFATNFNKLNQLTTGSNGIDVTRGAVTNPTGLQLQGNFDVAFSSTWTVFNLVWSSLDIYSAMGNSISQQFNFIPSQILLIVALTLISALIVIIIFTIISSIMRGRL